jgi:hypothetical protein
VFDFNHVKLVISNLMNDIKPMTNKEDNF